MSASKRFYTLKTIIQDRQPGFPYSPLAAPLGKYNEVSVNQMAAHVKRSPLRLVLNHGV